MNNKTSLEIECYCSTCGQILQPKGIRCKSKDGKDCFSVTLEPCKHCTRKSRAKIKKIRQRFHRRFSKPLRGVDIGGNFEPSAEVEKFLSDEEKQIEQERIMNEHAKSGKFGDVASGNQPFQD